MATFAEARIGRRERRERVRDRIIDSMLSLSSQRPFAELTIDEMARGAGLSRSAFYFYFRDKHEILRAATEGAAEELYAEAERWWAGREEPQLSVPETLADVASVYGSHAVVLRIATEVSTYDEEVRQFWRSLVERFVTATAEHLDREQTRGRVRPDLDPRSTAEALVWMLERCCYVYLGRGERTTEEVVEAIAPIWLTVLYGPDPAAVPPRGPGPEGAAADRSDVSP